MCIKTVNVGGGHLKCRDIRHSRIRFKALICAVPTTTTTTTTPHPKINQNCKRAPQSSNNPTTHSNTHCLYLKPSHALSPLLLNLNAQIQTLCTLFSLLVHLPNKDLNLLPSCLNLLLTFAILIPYTPSPLLSRSRFVRSCH